MKDVPVRISIDSSDADMSHKVADELKKSGFEILSASRRGVDVSASRDTIEDFFHCSVSGAAQPRFADEPQFGKLPEGPTYRAYIPRKPELM